MVSGAPFKRDRSPDKGPQNGHKKNHAREIMSCVGNEVPEVERDSEDSIIEAIRALDEGLYEKYTSGEITLAEFLDAMKEVKNWARRGAKLAGWII
jgi:hypothetical protein